MIKEIKDYARKNDLSGTGRQRQKVYERVILSNILRQECNATLFEIGRVFKRDHATIIHYLKTYQMLSVYSDFRQLEERIRELLDFVGLEEKLMRCETLEDFINLREAVKQEVNG